MTELPITIQPALLQRVSQKYHYMEQDMETLCQVADQMNHVLQGQCGFWLDGDAMVRDTDKPLGIVMSLGVGIDKLQEEYTARGNFVECYMTEVIADELLLDCYVAFNKWITANTDHYVKRYHFCGGGSEFPLEKMPQVIAASACDAVTCNEAYCLKPRKSVVFRAELTTDADTVCEGICLGCSNKYCANSEINSQILP